MSKTILVALGIVFLIAGFVGISYPGFLGMHLSAMHNLIHIITGMFALFFGTGGTFRHAKTFALLIGVAYGLLGLVGLLASPGLPSIPELGYQTHLWVVTPNVLEFGTNDSFVHLFAGIAFLIAAAVPAPFKISDAATPRTREMTTLK